ncbi:hypothetical protein [Bacteroides helcogenes]|uniref:Uncharacterized protein n=1 Tax=Bacteroides helcogenes (strain ATCC 35417 / DSM 20613 / JCM 6297 / CCUG 15421 / P 36-108) TaxID=693979 RepID=E6SWY0_BACT6|nr:hypothetical protein [Bacteroides helcogenes]ADV44668.1 hypothetical protein Bache_2723 [Bacteroides helcogenes P 36-108]MDY5238960.1 hypothetical protein [Bacteroides helcogenes]
MKKEKYVSPLIEVIQVENEGAVMVASGNLPGVGNGGSAIQSNVRSNSAGSSEIEDLINDILTIEQ